MNDLLTVHNVAVQKFLAPAHTTYITFLRLETFDYLAVNFR